MTELLQKAKELRRAGRAGEAALLLRREIAANPTDADVWREVVLVELKLANPDAARDALARAAALDGDSIRVAWTEAVLLEEEGRLEEAIAASRRIVERSPETRPFWAQLAQRLLDAGRHRECLAACDEGEMRAGASASLASQRGFCCHELDKPHDAVRAFAQALRLRSDDSRGMGDLLSCLGVALANAGHTSCAIRCYERGLLEEPDYEELHLNLGVSLRGSDPARAEQYFRKAIGLDPEYVNPHFELGWVLTRLKRHDEAETMTRQGMALEGEPDPWTYVYLGELFHSAGRMQAAEDEFRRAVEAYPNHAAARWLLASFLREKGEDMEAHEHQAKAALEEKSQPHSTLLLMRHLWDSGRRIEAEGVMRRQLLGQDPTPYRAWIHARLASGHCTTTPWGIT